MIAEPPINPNPSSLPAFGGEHPRSVLVGVGLHRHEMVKHPQVHGFGIMNVLGRRVVAERHDLDPLQSHDAERLGPAPVVADAHPDDRMEGAPYFEAFVADLKVALFEMLEG